MICLKLAHKVFDFIIFKNFIEYKQEKDIQYIWFTRS